MGFLFNPHFIRLRQGYVGHVRLRSGNYDGTGAIRNGLTISKIHEVSEAQSANRIMLYNHEGHEEHEGENIKSLYFMLFMSFMVKISVKSKKITNRNVRLIQASPKN